MSGTERNRLFLLLGVLGILVIVLVVQRYRSQQQSRGAGKLAEVDFAPQTVPALDLAKLTPAPMNADAGERNPFVFGRRPTPTPNLTPRPTLPPRPTRRPHPTPTPYVIHTGDGRTLPPPPPFTGKYIGYFGPPSLPVAVFREGKEVRIAPDGGVLDNVFIIRKVGYESVKIGYVGYPEEVTTRVPLEK